METISGLSDGSSVVLSTLVTGGLWILEDAVTVTAWSSSLSVCSVPFLVQCWSAYLNLLSL